MPNFIIGFFLVKGDYGTVFLCGVSIAYYSLSQSYLVEDGSFRDETCLVLVDKLLDMIHKLYGQYFSKDFIVRV